MATIINDLGVTFPDGRTQTSYGPYVHSQTGYEIIQGVMIAWGAVTTTASSYAVTYPLAFHPTGNPSAVVTPIAPVNDTGGLASSEAIQQQTYGYAGFTVSHYTTAVGFYWMAIGKAP